MVKHLLTLRKAALNDDFEVLAVASAFANNEVELLEVLMAVFVAGPWTTRVYKNNYRTSTGRWVHEIREVRNERTKNQRVQRHILFIAVEIIPWSQEHALTVKTLIDFGISSTSIVMDPKLDTRTIQHLLAAGADPNGRRERCDAINYLMPLDLVLHH